MTIQLDKKQKSDSFPWLCYLTILFMMMLGNTLNDDTWWYLTMLNDKTSQECETALSSQYWTLFLVLLFLSLLSSLSLLSLLSLLYSLSLLSSLSSLSFFSFSLDITPVKCLKGSQVSKVTLCVKIQKWRSVTHPLTKVRYRAARAAKKCRVSYNNYWQIS